MVENTSGYRLIELDINKRIGERIKKRREKMGLTQARLARHFGITFQQIHNYEKGLQLITAARLHMIADILCTDIFYFLVDDKKSRVYDYRTPTTMKVKGTHNKRTQKNERTKK